MKEELIRYRRKKAVELGRFYSRMYDFRQKGDYGDFVEFEKEKVEEWLDQVLKRTAG